MSDSVVMAITGLGAALMAASGALSTGRLAAVGAGVIFVAAAWKYVAARKQRNDRRSGDERRHTHPSVAVGSR